MRRIIQASAALVASVLASKDQFPKFDSAHANCAMKVEYTQQTCATTYALFSYTLGNLHPEPNAGGFYAVKEQSEMDYIWTTRTTPVHEYVDDVIFEFADTKTGCEVKSRSKSQTMSYYDYETNYCNMYNPHRYVGGFSGLTTSECKWVPTDATTTCDKY